MNTKLNSYIIISNEYRVMMFNNISVISWRSVLLVECLEKTTDKVIDKLYHKMLYRVHLSWTGFELTTLVVMGTDCIYIGSCKPSCHTIMTTTAPQMNIIVTTCHQYFIFCFTWKSSFKQNNLGKFSKLLVNENLKKILFNSAVNLRVHNLLKLNKKTF